jgi:thiosulfate/3-mercaptopyruvate sulfurtransferase
VRALVAVLVLLLGVAGGGAQAAAKSGPGPLVDATWLAGRLNDPGVVVIDVRSAEAYAAGHAPGARSAPYVSFGWRQAVDGVPEQLPPVPEISRRISSLGVGRLSQVVLIPAGESAQDFGAATRVYWTFKVLGHDRVSILDGGWKAWRMASGAVGTAPPAARSGDFRPRYRPELRAELATVSEALRSGAPLVDGRPPAHFTGAAKSGVVQGRGALPGAVNLPDDLLYDPARARFANRAEVAALARRLELPRRGPVITYCNTGHYASIAWFAFSEVLGNPRAALYDGSLAEWTQDPARAGRLRATAP